MKGPHNRLSKKVIAGLILLVLAVFGMWWYHSGEETAPRSVRRPQGPVQITASGYVTYALAREIGGEQVALSLLVPPGTEPHHFEPTPGSIIAVQQADLFLYTSAETEPWVRDILKGIDTVRSVAIAPVEAGEDPHIWMTPYGALSMAKQIAAALSKTDPAHKKYYQRNLKQFEQAMQQLHQAFEQGLANCQSREVVHVGHLAFGELAHAYDLQLHALTGTSHQGEHSARKLSNLVRLVRKNKVPVIFTEEMVSPDLARTLSSEARVRPLLLYTIEEISKTDFERGVRYEELMRRNLRHLQEGLVCQAS